MSWESIIGQHRVKNQLISTLQQRRPAHAYLFTGPSGVGKDAIALEFARVLNCERQGVDACEQCSSCLKSRTLQHPNIHLIFALPVGKGEESGDSPLAKLSNEEIELIQQQVQLKSQNPYYSVSVPKANTIKVNSVREIRRVSALSVVGKEKKIFIIMNADQMNEEASNALLKTLEEPHGHTLLILTTAHPDILLPTIISRCQVVRFEYLQEDEIQSALVIRRQIEASRSTVIARIANGSYARALELIDTTLFDRRAKAVEFLRTVLFKSRDELLQAIEVLVAEQERSEIEDFLYLLQSWLRDTMLMNEDIQRIVNIDDIDALKNFSTHYPEVDYSALLGSINRAVSLLNKNVYIPLILIHLSNQLRNIILAALNKQKVVVS